MFRVIIDAAPDGEETGELVSRDCLPSGIDVCRTVSPN
jgi:hypothetical protein